MRESITQERSFGCGIACFAFVVGITYQQAEEFLGDKQANSERFMVKDLREALNRYGLEYSSHYIKRGESPSPVGGSIVLLRRSLQFPVGHYLAFHNGRWMDPWINLPDEPRHSGFRDSLPGEVMYMFYPL